MDVHCSTCGEPWDVFHLHQDAIFETCLDKEEAEAWIDLPFSKKLSDRYREEFRAVGWEFGKSVVNVAHCPCCRKNAKPNPNRVAIKSVLEDLFGDDEDGLATTFKDHRL
jgi:hypothetical protein